jgi:hypothetical protein
MIKDAINILAAVGVFAITYVATKILVELGYWIYTDVIWRSPEKCAVCNKRFSRKEWEDRHDFHEDSCPHYETSASSLPYDCDCSGFTHDRCCPLCNGEK